MQCRNWVGPFVSSKTFHAYCCWGYFSFLPTTKVISSIFLSLFGHEYYTLVTKIKDLSHDSKHHQNIFVILFYDFFKWLKIYKLISNIKIYIFTNLFFFILIV